MEPIRLSDALAELRSELLLAMSAAENEKLKFELGPVEVELHVQVSTALKAGVGMKAWFLSASSEAGAQQAGVHKIKLILNPSYDGKTTVPVGDKTDVERE
jgi:hypothetical protein